jgi:hypothetical protein
MRFSGRDSDDQLTMWTCASCGARARVPINTPRIYCHCGYVQEGVTLGLGDMLAAGLHKVGITRQRYVRAKRAVGLKPKCGCGRRQRKLNELGRKIGIG